MTIWLVLLFAQSFAGPPQAARGQAVFFEGRKCGACHSLEGKGLAAGPDLTRLARIPPKAFKMAVLATRTQYVQNVKPKTGDAFPGMRVGDNPKATDFYDLSQTPPQLKKMTAEEIESTTDNANWKHPAESYGLTSQELADIFSYVRWVAYKDKTGVKADEM